MTEQRWMMKMVLSKTCDIWQTDVVKCNLIFYHNKLIFTTKNQIISII